MMFRPIVFLAGVAACAAPAFAQAPTADELSALRAQMRILEARIAELEARQAAPAVQPQAAAPEQPEVRFAAAPRVTIGDWSFKPRGRIQFDAGSVSAPDGIDDPGLGFASRLRRGRLGVEGDMPGGFSYRLDVEFSNNAVGYADLFLAYQASDALTLTVGHQNTFQGLERQTSDLFGSFMERAAFTNAFNFERRLGVSATWAGGPVRVEAGVFTDSLGDLADSEEGSGLGDENSQWSVDGRIVFAPRIGSAQLHLAGSGHYRDKGEDVAANIRYATRPQLRTTNVRFVGTPVLAVERETSWGVEGALVRGPLHVAGEAHWLRADTIDPARSPTLFGGYVEAGYFLTGETRGYRDGRFDRTRVLRPVSAGGWGALQLNARYDHLDLTDGGVRGGTQDAFLLGFTWIPQDYVRFLLNYGRVEVRDALLASPSGRRDYSFDIVGARAQVDF